MTENSSSQINEESRVAAVNEVVAKSPGIQHNTLEFIKAVGKKFIEKQVERFPEICEIARVQNILEAKANEKYGKKGKYTDTYGWSEDGTMRADYKIPQELYLFMTNLVNADFWSEENSKTWRRFMRRIVTGDDPYDALMEAKMRIG